MRPRRPVAAAAARLADDCAHAPWPNRRRASQDGCQAAHQLPGVCRLDNAAADAAALVPPVPGVWAVHAVDGVHGQVRPQEVAGPPACLRSTQHACPARMLFNTHTPAAAAVCVCMQRGAAARGGRRTDRHHRRHRLRAGGVRVQRVHQPHAAAPSTLLRRGRLRVARRARGRAWLAGVCGSQQLDPAVWHNHGETHRKWRRQRTCAGQGEVRCGVGQSGTWLLRRRPPGTHGGTHTQGGIAQLGEAAATAVRMVWCQPGAWLVGPTTYAEDGSYTDGGTLLIVLYMLVRRRVRAAAAALPAAALPAPVPRVASEAHAAAARCMPHLCRRRAGAGGAVEPGQGDEGARVRRLRRLPDRAVDDHLHHRALHQARLPRHPGRLAARRRLHIPQ